MALIIPACINLINIVGNINDTIATTVHGLITFFKKKKSGNLTNLLTIKRRAIAAIVVKPMLIIKTT